MHDAPVDAHEQAEQAHQAAHDSSPFLSRVTITIAILAVLAAGAGSLETLESGAAIIAANAAVLDQDRATDSWNLYQARSIKKYMLDIAADGPAAKDDYRAKSKTEGAGESEAAALAKRQETLRDTDLRASETHERRHHWLTIGTTLIEIGIALSTVAIITRRHWPWISAMVLGSTGAALTAIAYLSAA
jgi:hypothetical protein